MTLNEPCPIFLELDGQNFEEEVIPPGGGDVSEATRLHSALLWAYVFFIRQGPQYAFRSAIIYNSTETTGTDLEWAGAQKQFEVLEDTSGSERTLVIQSKGGVSAVGITPLNERRRPLDFTQLEVSANRCSIGYRKDLSPELLKIRLSGLNVMRVQTVWTCARTDEMKIIFPNPLAPLIQRPDVIRVDRLDNSEGGSRKLGEHFQALFGILFNKVSRLTFKLRCEYEYQIGEGLPKITIPVLLTLRQSSASHGQYISSLAGQLQRWYRSNGQQNGDFVFALDIFHEVSGNHLPFLCLQRLILPIESIADME